MSVVVDGTITQLSVSQAERFDHGQKGGCELAWWFERVHHQKPDGTAAKSAGDAGHRLFAHYFVNGKLPGGPAQMKKTVAYAILKGELPAPGRDMYVEWRGDGQEKLSKHTCECEHPLIQHDEKTKKCAECDCVEPKPKWLPLNKATTLWLGGIPWELFVDLAFRRDDVPTVIDHKFSADPEAYGKRDEELIRTIQMPVYVLGLINRGLWADAKRWRLLHNYNRKTSGLQFFRGDVFSMDQILERKADIETRVVPEMKAVARITSQYEVPFNRKSCDAWHGCPHQSICHAFKENKVALKPEEKELFDALESSGDVPLPKNEAPPPATELDEEAKLEAEFAARKAKIAADKVAKAELEKKAAEAAAAATKAAEQAAASKGPAEPKGEAIPDPAASGDQPPPSSAKGKGKAPAPAAIATVTLTLDLATFDKIRPLLK